MIVRHSRLKNAREQRARGRCPRSVWARNRLAVFVERRYNERRPSRSDLTATASHLLRAELRSYFWPNYRCRDLRVIWRVWLSC